MPGERRCNSNGLPGGFVPSPSGRPEMRAPPGRRGACGDQGTGVSVSVGVKLAVGVGEIVGVRVMVGVGVGLTALISTQKEPVVRPNRTLPGSRKRQ